MRHKTLTHTRARSLRKNMSEPEVMLWSRPQGRGADRRTFRRQHPIGPFIVDFYCPSVRLAVEIDGAVHSTDEQGEKDRARDGWLEHQGVTVLRIPASAIYRHLDEVVGGIFRRVGELHTGRRLAPSTTRSSAGGPPPAAAHATGEVDRGHVLEAGLAT